MKKFLLLMIFISIVSLPNAIGQNLVVNGDFESWTGSSPDGWTTIDGGINVTEETTTINGGLSSASIEVTTASQSSTDFRQSINVISGHEYSISVWVYHTEGYMEARLYVDNYLNYSSSAITGAWQEVTNSYTASSTGSIEIGLRFYDQTGFDGSEIVYVDDYVITDLSGGNTPPSISNIVLSPTGISSSTSVSVSADVTDSDGSITNVTLNWGTSPGSLGTSINMSLDAGDTYITDTDIPAQANGTTVYYEIEATDDEPETTTTSEYSYDVTDPATTTLPYYQTFDSDLGDCYTYSVLGEYKYWIWDDNGGTDDGHAYMNGYNFAGTEPENDWLILPGINLDNYSDEVMHFYTSYAYGNNDIDNYLKLFYSTDYPGIGDPSGYSWTELSFSIAGGWDTWLTSGLVDLSGISGTSVYIGFQYASTADPRSWRIDDITIADGASKVDVTFQLNMAEQTSISEDGVHIAGSFPDDPWNPAGYVLEDLDLDEVYTTVISLYPGVEYQFKYINGNDWPFNETVPADCQAPESSNRFVFTGTSDYAIDPVCFSSCQDCGTPDWNVTFRVDMFYQNVTGDVYIAGAFNGFSNQLMTNTMGSIYEATILLEEGASYEYKFKNGPDGWEDFSGDCTVGEFNNRTVTVPAEETTLDLVCFNSCDACPVPDLVITEVMQNPAAVNDSNGEWFELYNAGGSDVNIDGFLIADLGSDSHPIDNGGSLIIPAGGFLVLGINSDNLTNGGLTVDYQYSSFSLANGDDEIILYMPDGITVIDEIAYDGGPDWPDPTGASMTLNPAMFNSLDNDDGLNWYEATSSYGDGDLGTPGADNDPFVTEWTGASDDAWFNDGNWSNGQPGSSTNALIPATASTFPVLYVEGGETDDLTIEAGASLEIKGSLTVYGTFSNNGDLTIKSEEGLTGSLITNSAVTGTMECYFTGNTTDWHLVSSPISLAQAGVFLGMYMQSFDNSTYVYTDIEDENQLMNVMEGYAAYSTLADDNTVSYTGTFNPGPEQIAVTTGADSYNWNLVGNPFPCSIDWETVTIPANMSNEIHYIDAASGADLSYVQGVGGTGAQFVAPGQGFFVSVTAGATFELNAAAKAHSGATLLKNSNPNLLVIEASGENFSDQAWIHFNENALAEHDGQFDAYKRISLSNPELPQIFSYTPSGEMLSISGMPQTEMVPVGFTAVESGQFTIAAIETGDFTKVILEDKLLGTQTDLLLEDYTFNFEPGVMEDRFIIHFAPVGVDEISKELVNIYSFNKDVYVTVPESTDGLIKVFNMMGQEILATQITDTVNKIKIEETGNYIITVVSDTQITSEKVFIQ